MRVALSEMSNLRNLRLINGCDAQFGLTFCAELNRLFSVPKTAARHHRLLYLLRSEGEVTVGELSRTLQVGTATIRRDLHSLAQRGQIVRTYGGAVLGGGYRTQAPRDSGALAKRYIGVAAAQLVRSGQTVVITGGSTTMELARQLVGRYRLTVITNALNIASVLQDDEQIEVIVTGGVIRRGMHSLLGHLTEIAAAELRADTLFMGIPAISPEEGLMSDYMPEVLTDRAVRQMAQRVVVLADSSKFQRVAPAYVFGLDEVDTIVTDEGIDSDLAGKLEARGVKLVVAHGKMPANPGS